MGQSEGEVVTGEGEGVTGEREGVAGEVEEVQVSKRGWLIGEKG